MLLDYSAPATATSSRMFATTLPGNVIYWRAGSFTPATSWEDITAQTNKVAANATGLILDLRSNSTSNDFGGALRVAGFLSRGQTGLSFYQADFRMPTANTSGSLRGQPMLIVLTNRETQGAAEILAASLQAQGALVMGEETKGKVVVPDVTTSGDSQEEASALALIDRQQVGNVISEVSPRHRMSEAALVRGQDPEQDAFIAAHESATTAPAPVTRDIALVEALDSFKAIHVLESQESAPQARVASSASAAGQTVIASTGLGR